ncbi:molybdopterin molybdotransferase MoeA [Pseudoneobacillus rhizosphaerae]|uniref:Molybdopterin molybdenumtransferase n=1 Tax=Pseudoneobacillus rhizosphaerae TaxID=2880968 RepID=A0A9C7G6D8_9BACI|nr:gephyrin-like molybdotransferase Glp [Pseudoneobacillus rhizosphaerae]CAG9606739.1 Molybdopterin molybdenumtransferase [Pseudoneobacillus rhizosphaerae]
MEFFKVKTVEETYQLIKQQIKPILPIVKKSLYEALHFVLAEDIYIKENVPNFRRSAVDGYAVKASDTFGTSESMPGFLTVTGEVKMGKTPPCDLSFGEAMYVPTGGMVPEASDSIVMVEHCEDLNGLLNVFKQIAPGENVISIGEDLVEGEILLTKGTRLRPQELGALASQGIIEVSVYRKPVVGYISTGDEIVPIETVKPALGEIRDMNGMTIGAMVMEWGYEFIHDGIVQDDEQELAKRSKALLEKVDCLILSGGSSVGTKDYSVNVIESLGKPGVFVHGISIKPGKPTILAVADGKPIIGLPGHPASAMVIFQLFARPILNEIQGYSQEEKQLAKARITKNIPSAPGRTDYIRVRLFQELGEWYAEPIFGKSSLISTFVKSEGLVEVPAPNEGVQKGDQVLVRLFNKG